MQPRLDYTKVSPGARKAMLGLEAHVAQCGLEHALIHLIKMRASQINGCAYCLDMHSKDARAGGETEQRLYALNAWHETPFYTERERAALAWTEALTLVAETHVPDDVFQAARAQFSEQELVDLTLAVVAINGWNRIAVGFRTEPGTYQPMSRLQGQSIPAHLAQTGNLGPLDLEAVSRLVDDISRSLSVQGGSPALEEIRAEVETLRTVISTPRPKHSWVSDSLTSLKHTLEGATGEVIVDGIKAGQYVEAIGRILGLK